MTHHLDLAQCIGTIAAAVQARTLQTYTNIASSKEGPVFVTCQYAGPCAVGVCVPVELRAALDDDKSTPDGDLSVTAHFAEGNLSCPSGQRRDWSEMQDAHDLSMFNGHSAEHRAAALERFEAQVVALQAKYAPGAGAVPGAA